MILLNAREVRVRTGIKWSVLNRMIRCGQFPRPAYLGGMRMWTDNAVDDAMAACGWKAPEAPVKLRAPGSIIDNADRVAGTPVLSVDQITARATRPPVECGIYFLVRSDEIVYVGQSVNAAARVAVHARDEGKLFDRWMLLPCEPCNLDLMESFYIHRLQPRDNGRSHTGERCAPMSEAGVAKYLDPTRRSKNLNVVQEVGKLSTDETKSSNINRFAA